MQSSNYSVVLKGQYAHKQTNEFLKISRYLIIRKKYSRYLALEFENLNTERLDSLALQIDQYDARGNYLGTYDYRFDKLSAARGVFVLKEKILLNSYCADFFVKITFAKYGKFIYRLGDDGMYSVFDDSEPSQKVAEETLDKTVLKNGRRSDARKFTAPAILGVLFALCVAAFMAVSTLRIDRFKQDETSFILNNVEYEFVDPDKAEGTDLVVKGYAGYGGGNITIGEELEGYKIKRISKDAFAGDRNIRSLTIEGDVELENYAFSACENLTKVVLNGVKSVSNKCFYNCPALAEVEIRGAEKIGESAFANCNQLRKIEIGAEEIELVIGDSAFARCYNLQDITVDQFIRYGSSMNYFYNSGSSGGVSLKLKNFNYAPYETDGLTNKTLNQLFGGYSSVALTDIEIENVSVITSDFCRSVSSYLNSFKVDNLEVKKIGARAFSGCTYLSSLSLPTITEVGAEAFKNTAITGFDASYLDTIGESAFYGCTYLSKFDLKNNTKLTELPRLAFYGCYSLSSFYIPKKIAVIGENCFGSSGLKTVEFNPENTLNAINSNTFRNCASLKTVVLPTSVVEIGDYAFYNCAKLYGFNLPENLVSIGTEAFANCSSLSSCVIPGGITELKSGTFNGCSSLRTATLNDGLETIGSQAFAGTALSECVIPDSVSTIGEGIFSGANGLARLTVPFIGSTLGSPRILGYFFGTSSYQNQTNIIPDCLEQVVITRAQRVADYAFYGLSGLSDVSLSEQTTRIGTRAFSSCMALRYIILPASLTYVASNAFEYCYKLFEIENRSNRNIVRGSGIAQYALKVYGAYEEKMPRAQVSGYAFMQADDGWYMTDVPTGNTLTLPNAVRGERYIMPPYLFYGLTVNGITFTSGVKEIKDNCFDGVDGLKNISTNNASFDFTSYAFNGVYTLENVNLSGLAATSLPTDVFADRQYLTKVVLSDNVQTIGDRAFVNCSMLSDINFPESLVNIGDYAFSGCNALSAVELPYATEYVGENAFANCYNVQEVSLSENLSSLGNYAFSGCNALSVVTFPYGLKTSATISDTAFSGCTNIYEVFDLTGSSGYKIVCGDEKYGAVARYAVVVHKNASEERLKSYSVNGATYKYTKDICALVKFNSSGYGTGYKTEKVVIGNQKRTFIINRNAFTVYLSKLTITDAVTEIREGAFTGTVNLLVFSGSALNVDKGRFSGVSSLVFDSRLKSIAANAFRYSPTVYFKGTEQEWNASSYKSSIAYAPQYFYSECIHEAGLKLWNYSSSGFPNTAYTSYYYRVLKYADCEHDGEEEYYCDKCGHSEKNTLPKLGHDYRYYLCSRCGDVQDADLTGSTYADLSRKVLTFTNDKDNPYDMFEDINGAILAPVLDAGERAELTITAKTNVKLSFKCNLSEKGIGEITVIYGNETTTVSTISPKQFDFDLKQGDKIRLVFTKSDSESTENGAIIDTIKVS